MDLFKEIERGRFLRHDRWRSTRLVAERVRIPGQWRHERLTAAVTCHYVIGDVAGSHCSHCGGRTAARRRHRRRHGARDDWLRRRRRRRPVIARRLSDVTRCRDTADVHDNRLLLLLGQHLTLCRHPRRQHASSDWRLRYYESYCYC